MFFCSKTVLLYFVLFSDFVLTFEKEIKERKNRSAEEVSERQKKRENKRKSFLEALENIGIQHEIELPKVLKK